MQKSAFYYSPLFLEHKPLTSHPENPNRLKPIIEAINKDTNLSKIPFIKPQKASEEIIGLNHSKEHIENINNLSGFGNLDPDTYFSPKSSEAAFLAAGAGINSVNDISTGKIDNAFCLVRPPGHHAEKNHAMGFCLFNNAAITAHYAMQNNFSKIAIIDWDAHHGNGTQHSFYTNDKVLYISLHHYPFYPGTGAIDETGEKKGKGFNINFAFNHDSTNGDYKIAFDSTIIPVLKQYKPDLIIISAGYDAHKNDPLGGLSIDENGFMYMAHCLHELQTKGIILLLEGGYDLAALNSSSLKTFNVLADINQETIIIKEKPQNVEIINRVNEIHKPYWSINA